MFAGQSGAPVPHYDRTLFGGDVPLSVETRLSGAAWFEVMRRPSSVQAGLFDGSQEELA
jgi:hypothetical protein